MANNKTKVDYVPQKRREFRRVSREFPARSLILRKSISHSELIKRNIVDGCCSTTSIFDEECAEVPSIFDPRVSRFELADELMRAGSTKSAQDVAEDGVQSHVD